MGGQTLGETMGFGVLARASLGLNPQALHAERVDGYNPLAVADAIERKKRILLAGLGPVLLDTVTYRFIGHSTSDPASYRDRSGSSIECLTLGGNCTIVCAIERQMSICTRPL